MSHRFSKLNKIGVSVLFLLLLLILSPMSSIQAKRMVPKPVDPISYQGISYSAPGMGMMGSVVARDEKTDQIVWTTKVYSVVYDPDLESDVQDVFITKLEIAGGKLLVTNEEDRKYQVDLETGKVLNDPWVNNVRLVWLAVVVFVLVSLFTLYKYLLKK